MKIFRAIISFIIITMFVTLTIFASETQNYVFEYEIPEITVSFDEGTVFSEEERQEIADSFAGIISDLESLNAPNNIICSIFGHNLSTGEVSVLRHKVTHRAPRCRLEIYDVTACSRCDYTEQVLVTSSYIFCCPEELPLPENTNPTE